MPEICSKTLARGPSRRNVAGYEFRSPVRKLKRHPSLIHMMKRWCARQFPQARGWSTRGDVRRPWCRACVSRSTPARCACRKLSFFSPPRSSRRGGPSAGRVLQIRSLNAIQRRWRVWKPRCAHTRGFASITHRGASARSASHLCVKRTNVPRRRRRNMGFATTNDFSPIEIQIFRRFFGRALVSHVRQPPRGRSFSRDVRRSVVSTGRVAGVRTAPARAPTSSYVLL